MIKFGDLIGGSKFWVEGIEYYKYSYHYGRTSAGKIANPDDYKFFNQDAMVNEYEE
jgi:hypothetical protein